LHEHKENGQWLQIHPRKIVHGPRELNDAELALVGGGGLLGWLKTAVSATYAAAGALLGGPGGAFAGKIVGDIAGDAVVAGTKYGDAHSSMMM
jgi:hypothetical protein